MVSGKPVELIWVGLLGILVVFPFLHSAIYHMTAAPRVQDTHPGYDQAVLEIGTLHAAKGIKFLGPYSRFKWSHPGPIFYYSVLPFYSLLGWSQTGLVLGVLFVNLAAATTILIVAYSVGRERLYLATAVLLVLYIFVLGGKIASFWNPFSVILPFCAVVILFAAVAIGRVRFLPAAVLFSSYVVQTHIGLAPTTLAVALAAFVIMSLLRSKKIETQSEDGRGRALVWILVSAVVLIILWSPVLIEEFLNLPGNLSQTIGFFIKQGGEGHPIDEAFPALADRLMSLPFSVIEEVSDFLSGTRMKVPALPAFIILLLLLAASLFAGYKLRKNYLISLSLLCLVAKGAALFSATRIADRIQWYILYWSSAIGVASLAVSLAAGFEAVHAVFEKKNTGKVRVAVAIAALILMAVLAARNTSPSRERSFYPGHHEAIAFLSEEGKEYMANNEIESPEIRIVHHDYWGVAAGVILQLYKAGIPFSVEDDWLYMFGKQLKSVKTSPHQWWFCDAVIHERLAGGPMFNLVAEHGGIYLYSFDREEFDRSLYKGELTVQAEGTRGRPVVITDGEIAPPGSGWNSPKCLRFRRKGASVTLRVPPGKLAGIALSSTNEDFEVLCSEDGRNFSLVGVIKKGSGLKMRTRMFFSEEFFCCRYLRIAPKSLEGKSSISEVGLLFKRNTPGI